MREIIQENAAELSREHPNLILEFATGVGKTASALKCIERSVSDKKWLVLVPETALIENFKADAIKHGYEYLLKEKIEEVLCYASLKNYRHKQYNLAMDEAHHTSDLRLDHLSSIESDQRICLSATLPAEVRERLETLGTWHTYKITTQEAIDNGILPEPEIYVKMIRLDDIDKKYTYKLKNQKTIKCTARQYYDRLDKTVEYWKQQYNEFGGEWRQKRWMFASINRKRWLGEYKSKIASDLLKTIGKDRAIIFCATVEQACKLGGKQAVHSKNTTKQNQTLLDEFNSQTTDKLFCCGMLQEGVNLTKIDSGLIIQLAANDRYTVQSVGRVLRGVAPKIYITSVIGTRDEYYLEQALQLFRQKPIYI